jgi:enamine deaminase RidA (YjgF/YER057c/UK114 family)
MAKIERYGAPGVFEPATYSQGVKVTESKAVLFIAGQVAYDKDGGPAHRGDFKGQARDAFKAIKALVEAQGGTLDNVVKLNTYITDVRYRADLVPVREEFFGKKGPASTLVQVAALAHPAPRGARHDGDRSARLFHQPQLRGRHKLYRHGALKQDGPG